MINYTRVLILDDVPSDAELMVHELKNEDIEFNIKKVDNRQDFIDAISFFTPDIILSDFRMPQFSGLEALHIVKEMTPKTPILIVTGSIDEETAAECIKAGAWDYILKQHITRLGKAVTNALLLKEEKEKKEHAENALIENITQLQGILGSLRETLIVVYDAEGIHKFVWASPELDERYGITYSQLLGQSVSKLYSPADAIKRINDIKKIFSTGEAMREELLTRFPNGSYWHDTSLTPMKNPAGEIIGVVGFLLDITNRKRAEVDRTQLATAFEQVAECIIITDTYANIIYVNKAVEQITGFTTEELLNQNCRIFKSGRHDALFYKNLWKVILGGKIWTGRLFNRKKDGSIYEEKVTISPIRDINGTIINFVAVKKDITEETRLERQLHQAQKMEAIGTLAGGIAHDFNNILAAILGYTELSLREVKEGARLHRNLEQVLQAGYRAKDLIKQILAFSRLNQQEKKPLQVSLIIKEALKLLRASLPATIEMRQNITAKNNLVMADPTQMHQVLMNLCTNAAHAMLEKGGILDVSLREVVISPEEIGHYHGIKPGVHLKLSVSDTGHGMTPEIIERIFEPYFTTKKPGEGTGMGLSVVHGIVKSHGGDITVYSEPDRGTSVHILLPCIESETEDEKNESSPMPHGEGTILFVDDEISLVTIGKEMLEQLGYTVIAKTDSIEALEEFIKTPQKFDLVVTDQTMPVMTGAELAQKIFAMRPDIPIVLCTGFSEVISEEKAKAIGIREFIMKPIFMKEIAFVIRNLLDERLTGEL